MTQQPLQDQGFPGVLESFESLETLFNRGARADEDLSLCFMCLRWTTGDEGCRRGYRCELQDALEHPEGGAERTRGEATVNGPLPQAGREGTRAWR